MWVPDKYHEAFYLLASFFYQKTTGKPTKWIIWFSPAIDAEGKIVEFIKMLNKN